MNYIIEIQEKHSLFYYNNNNNSSKIKFKINRISNNNKIFGYYQV